MTHVIPVLIPKSFQQHPFLDIYPVAVTDDDDCNGQDCAKPGAGRQSKPANGNEAPGLRGMAYPAIWPGHDEALISVNSYDHREGTAQAEDCPFPY